MGNSLPAQQTIPRTKHIVNAISFLVKDFFLGKSYSLPIVTRQWEVVN